MQVGKLVQDSKVSYTVVQSTNMGDKTSVHMRPIVLGVCVALTSRCNHCARIVAAKLIKKLVPGLLDRVLGSAWLLVGDQIAGIAVGAREEERLLCVDASLGEGAGGG